MYYYLLHAEEFNFIIKLPLCSWHCVCHFPGVWRTLLLLSSKTWSRIWKKGLLLCYLTIIYTVSQMKPITVLRTLKTIQDYHGTGCSCQEKPSTNQISALGINGLKLSASLLCSPPQLFTVHTPIFSAKNAGKLGGTQLSPGQRCQQVNFWRWQKAWSQNQLTAFKVAMAPCRLDPH